MYKFLLKISNNCILKWFVTVLDWVSINTIEYQLLLNVIWFAFLLRTAIVAVLELVISKFYGIYKELSKWDSDKLVYSVNRIIVS